MDQLEKKLRDKIIKILKIIVIVSFVLDISFSITFYITGAMDIAYLKYLMRYVVTPALLNTITYILAKVANNSDKQSDDNKNLICSMALCTIAGTMSVFHSYYAPLWMAPSLTMLFCSVFHNKKIYRYLLTYSCILVIFSGLFIITEETLDVSYVIEQCVVAEALTIICSLVAREVSVYQINVLEITKKSLRNEEKYRNRLDYDTLTGVHSRAFMDKVIREVFGVKDGTDEVGFAIIDLDNFKNVNDTYGHDNGDIVLKVLGDLLNKQASDTVIVGRFGGEEFIIVFKDGSLKEYNEQIDIVQSMLNGYSFDFMEERVSFSAGLISCKSSMKYEEVFKLADEALYVSKNTGKKKTTVKEII